jgi:cytochrome c553
MASLQKKLTFFGVIGSCVALIATLFVLKASVLLLSREYQTPPAPAWAADNAVFAPALAKRGDHLVNNVLGCGQCHSPTLTGQKVIDEPGFGTLYSANLTHAKRHVASLHRALRYGVDTQGHALWLMPAAALAGLSEPDLQAVIAYLGRLPSADLSEKDAQAQRTALGQDKQISARGRIRLALRLSRLQEVDGALAATPEPTPQTEARLGAYLAHVARCDSCHRGAASQPPVAPEHSQNPAQMSLYGLTAKGLQAYARAHTMADFLEVMAQTPAHPAAAIPPPVSTWHAYAKMGDDEVKALWAHYAAAGRD